MADREAARWFGEIFKLLAERSETEVARRLARVTFKAIGEHDFAAYQMDADEALRSLGLGRCVDEDR